MSDTMNSADESYEERMAARAERRKLRQQGSTVDDSSIASIGSTATSTSTPAPPKAVFDGFSSVRSPGNSSRGSILPPSERKSLFEKPAESSGAAPVSTDKGTKRFTVMVEKCSVCEKTVYPLEKIEADGKKYHKTCFKCEQCKKTLSLGTYAALQGKFYCKPHFKQLFKLKGNYDEGFGRSMRKNDWIYKEEDGSNPDGAATPATPAPAAVEAEAAPAPKANKLRDMFQPPEPAKEKKEEKREVKEEKKEEKEEVKEEKREEKKEERREEKEEKKEEKEEREERKEEKEELKEVEREIKEEHKEEHKEEKREEKEEEEEERTEADDE